MTVTQTRILWGIGSMLASAVVIAGCAGGSAAPQSKGGDTEEGDAQSETDGSSASAVTPDPLADLWETMTPQEQAASLLILHYPGVDPEATAEFIADLQPGGIILMGDNIPDPESSLTSATLEWQSIVAANDQPPLIISIDQEGGVVSRLNSDPAPGAQILRDGDPDEVEAAFAARADLLASLGINTNFGIVADTTEDEASFIYSRVLGTSPETSAAAVTAAVMGEEGKVASTLKHFPGHGMTPSDSHEVIAACETSEEEWRHSAALPFEAGIAAGAPLVMMSHLSCPAVDATPASMSPAWYRILREDLGFDGVIVTDDMSMLVATEDPDLQDPAHNAVRALQAGATMVLSIGGNTEEEASAYAHDLVEGIAAAITDGTLDPATLRDAGIRALAFREGL